MNEQRMWRADRIYMLKKMQTWMPSKETIQKGMDSIFAPCDWYYRIKNERRKEMSLYDYKKSKEISKDDPPFAAIIMSAMRKADTESADLLRIAFPEIQSELQLRYDAPGGRLPYEEKEV